MHLRNKGSNYAVPLNKLDFTVAVFKAVFVLLFYFVYVNN